MYRVMFREAQRGKVLEQFVFLNGCYLLSLDGTQYFSSTKIHCLACLEKTNAKTGVVTYSHQMLGAALVHPDRREVIPLCPEPITKQDGNTKNDCERNAVKRFVKQFRRDHPHLDVIVIEDGPSSNAPIFASYSDSTCISCWASQPMTMRGCFESSTRQRGLD